ncbi:MAG: hypothetical protein WD768_22340 [Phycisphaeraceae bacterium]
MHRRMETILLPCLIMAMIGAVTLAPVMAMTVDSTGHICTQTSDACAKAMPTPQPPSCCAKHDVAATMMACHTAQSPVQSIPSNDSKCPDHCPCCVVGPMSVAWVSAPIDSIHFSASLTHDDVAMPALANPSDWVLDLFHPPCL